MALTDSKKIIEKYGFWIYSLLLAIIVFYTLGVEYNEWLIRIESKSLFIYNGDFFKETVLVPTGLLSYISLFLTQFLHSPLIGTTIFTLLLFFSAFITKVAYNISDRDSIIAFLPAVLILIINGSIGYALYTLKSPGFFFMPVLGYAISTTAVWGISRIKSPVLSIPAIIIWCFLGYLSFGIYALAATVAVTVIQYKRECINVARIAILLFAVIFLVFTPLITYNLTTTVSSISKTFLLGIPNLTAGQHSSVFGTAFAILIAIQIALSIYKPLPQAKAPSYLFMQSGILIIYLLSAYLCWFRDPNFKAEIAMSNAIDNNNWKEVCNIHKEISDKYINSDRKAYEKLSAKANIATSPAELENLIKETKGKFYEPSRMMVQFKNLALVKLGTEANQAFAYKDGGRIQKFKNTIPIALQCGKQLYLHYGLPFFAYRWCIEEAVEYGWNVDNLKYATLSCILTGDYGVACKFLDKLDKTLYHKRWAKEVRKYIDHPSLIAEAEQFKSIKQLMCYDSTLDNDNAVIESYLIKHFTTHRPQNATPQFDRVAMLWALQTQDIATFWKCFSNYIQTNDTQKMPRYYQEAALLYGNLEKSVNISNMPFDKAVLTSYENFNRFSSGHAVRSIEVSRFPYSERFGNTFYFYYYFIRNLNTY